MEPTELTLEQAAVKTDADAAHIRQSVRRYAQQLGFGLTDLTKLITATSELSRNMIQYGGGGWVTIEQVANQAGPGLRIQFEDSGPGIADIQQAMQDGYTTGGGLGLGLPATRRLVHHFSLWSEPNQGTRIVITMWQKYRQ